MKTTSKILITVFLLFCLISCENDESIFDGNSCSSNCIIFNGIITDPNNEIPVECDIIIEHTDNSFLPNLTRIGETTTDTSGFFQFSFDGTNYSTDDGYFTVKAVKNGYLTNDIDGKVNFYTINSSQFDTPINADIFLRPEATLQFSITMASSSSISDFNYSYKYANTEYQNSIPNENLTQSILREHSVGGDQEVSVHYQYKNNSQQIEVNDSILILAGEVLTIEI